MWKVYRGGFFAIFFAIVIWVLIPAHVPRPAFIPGFAPPPDFWPRVASVAGLLLGLLAAVTAWLAPSRPEDVGDETWSMTGPASTLAFRFLLALCALAIFVAAVPVIGFTIAAILLTAAMTLLTGERQRLLWASASAVILPVALAYFFSEFLGTQFPGGVLFG